MFAWWEKRGREIKEKVSNTLTSLKTLIILESEELSLIQMDGEDNQDLKLSLQNLIICNLPRLEVLP